MDASFLARWKRNEKPPTPPASRSDASSMTHNDFTQLTRYSLDREGNDQRIHEGTSRLQFIFFQHSQQHSNSILTKDKKHDEQSTNHRALRTADFSSLLCRIVSFISKRWGKHNLRNFCLSLSAHETPQIMLDGYLDTSHGTSRNRSSVTAL